MSKRSIEHYKSKNRHREKERDADTDDDAIVEEYGQDSAEDRKSRKKDKGKKDSGKKRSKSKSSKKSRDSDSGEKESDEDESAAAITESFRKAVINYIKYDNKSRQLRELQSQLNKKKKELSELIVGKMDDTHMKSIAITGGKLHRNKAETQAPLKHEMIEKTLKKELGKSRAKELMEKIQDQRPMTTRINLKRVKEREKASSSSKKSHSRSSSR